MRIYEVSFLYAEKKEKHNKTRQALKHPTALNPTTWTMRAFTASWVRSAV